MQTNDTPSQPKLSFVVKRPQPFLAAAAPALAFFLPSASLGLTGRRAGARIGRLRRAFEE